MVKRFCKMNRQEISSSLGQIHQLVSVPKYICQSCVRSSSHKASLCKPALIPQQVSQSKAVAKEALDNNATVVSEGTVDTAKLSERSLLKGDNKTDGVGKKQAKKIKKQLKKQSKQCKKLKKLIKQQKKLQTKHLKLKSKIYQLDNQLTAASIIVEPIMEAPQVH